MNKGLKVFITYARKDSAAKDELITRLAVLKREGLINIWHDNEILPSDRWREEIFSTHLPSSDVLLYLVSAYSLDSATCNEELAAALNAKIRVLPIILEACDWENQKLSTPQAPLGASIPKLSDIHVLPDERLPINEWDPKSKGWQNVVKGIRKVINKMHAQASDSAKEEVLPEWVFQQGNFLLMLGEIDKAIEAYSHVLGLNPHSPDAYNNRGSAYYSIGSFSFRF